MAPTFAGARKNTKGKVKLFYSVIPAKAGIHTVAKAAPCIETSSYVRKRGAPIRYSLAPVKQPCVCILAGRRVFERKTGALGGFTSRYGVYRLVYAESHASMGDAIAREKQIKKWRRAWKIEMIERGNPTWRDLYDPQSL
ncbi:MAG TPA: GIY-YIG nuclease family protein [Stellaceae bacterium]|nr:GIY-YIG nuclease family protein [Stellaceae bacterium]